MNDFFRGDSGFIFSLWWWLYVLYIGQNVRELYLKIYKKNEYF